MQTAVDMHGARIASPPQRLRLRGETPQERRIRFVGAHPRMETAQTAVQNRPAASAAAGGGASVVVFGTTRPRRCPAAQRMTANMAAYKESV